MEEKEIEKEREGEMAEGDRVPYQQFVSETVSTNGS